MPRQLSHFRVAVLIAGVVLPASSRADIITIEPDAYAAGTYLSTAIPGIELWAMQKTASPLTGFSLLPIYSTTGVGCVQNPLDCAAVTGTQVLGYGTGSTFVYSPDAARAWSAVNHGGTVSPFSEEFTALMIEFDSPTSFVELSSTFWSQDNVILHAYDSSFNQLHLEGTTTCLQGMYAVCQQYREGDNFAMMLDSIMSPEGQIKYVIAGSWDEGWTSIDTIRYQGETVRRVPEPTSLIFLGVGLIAVGLWQRRRP